MQPSRVRIGDYCFDPARYELSCGERVIKLERDSMELLILLLERRGGVVTRNEIGERLWGKDAIPDLDNSINSAVRKLRGAFGDNPERSAFIKTLSGKGVPVRGAGWRNRRQWPESARCLQCSRSRIFPPIRNRTTLQTVSWRRQSAIWDRWIRCVWGVIARTSSMAYKRTTKSVAQIGRELGVDYILESSVRLPAKPRADHVTAGSRERPDASLVTELQSGRHKLPGAAGRIGKGDLAHHVNLKLPARSDSAPRSGTQDVEAYHLYLRGRYCWNQLMPASVMRATGYFEQAAERDPSYALALVGLAECYAMLPIACDTPPLEILPKALAAARGALRLNDSLAEAHAAMGAILLWMEWDWEGAETSLRRAIALNPSYVHAHRWYAVFLCAQGRHAESAAEMQKARNVDPLSALMHGLSGGLNVPREPIWARTRASTGCAGDELESMDNPPMDGESPGEPGAAGRGGRGGSRRRLSYPGATQRRSQARHTLRRGGAIARKLIRRSGLLLALSATKYVPPSNIALIFTGLSEYEYALVWLEKAHQSRDARMTLLAVESKWHGLRNHVRFHDLLRRMGLPEMEKPLGGKADVQTKGSPAL